MKTDDWISMLARNAGPAPRVLVAHRLVPVMLLGLMSSALLSLVLIGPLAPGVYLTPSPWMKLLYATALALAASVLTARLARPVARLRVPQFAVGALLVCMVAWGLLVLGITPPEQRWSAVLGQTWISCPWLLMGFSLPSLAGVLWVLKGFAPTQPHRAGFAGGLLAGALGAGGYALACPESSPAFMAIWYTLGIVMTGGIGGVLGPKVLRW